MSDHRIIKTTLMFANVYEKYQPSMGIPAFYSLSFPAFDLPDDWRGLFKIHEPNSRVMLSSRQPPVVVPSGKLDLGTLLQCARDTNIHPDRLLMETPVEISATKVRIESSRPMVKPWKIVPLAVLVDVDAMTRRFDDICREAFGESIPEMILRKNR